MGKVGFPISSLQPFDFPYPEQESEIEEGIGIGSLHFKSRIIVGFDNEVYASPNTELLLKLLKDRGAKRYVDYLVTLRTGGEDGPHYLVIHMKPGFVSVEEDK